MMVELFKELGHTALLTILIILLIQGISILFRILKCRCTYHNEYGMCINCGIYDINKRTAPRITAKELNEFFDHFESNKNGTSQTR